VRSGSHMSAGPVYRKNRLELVQVGEVSDGVLVAAQLPDPIHH
jgi:hypothetical protein